MLVAISVIALVSPRELAASDAPLATAASAVSLRLAGILGAVALFVTANTGLVAVIVTSRLLYGMARAGHVAAAVARVWSGRQTPWVAAVVVLGLALSLLPLGGVALVASLSSFGALVAFIVVNATLIVLRFRQPRRRRPFRVPFAVARVPIPAALGIATTLLLAAQFDAVVYVGGAVAIATGIVLYFLRSAQRERRGRARRARRRS